MERLCSDLRQANKMLALAHHPVRAKHSPEHLGWQGVRDIFTDTFPHAFRARVG